MPDHRQLGLYPRADGDLSKFLRRITLTHTPAGAERSSASWRGAETNSSMLNRGTAACAVRVFCPGRQTPVLQRVWGSSVRLPSDAQLSL
jgi:hypothetical protein